MPILGNQTFVAARITRATSNALRIGLIGPDGTELARAQQTGGVGVLVGFKNGGKSDYTLSGAAGDELRLAVAATTTVTNQNSTVGRIVPADGAARLESGGGTVLAVLRPHTGSKADGAWHHPILSPAGDELGVLTLMTVHTGWRDIENDAILLLSNQNIATLKAPSAGAMLKLRAPVAPQLATCWPRRASTSPCCPAATSPDRLAVSSPARELSFMWRTPIARLVCKRRCHTDSPARRRASL